LVLRDTASGLPKQGPPWDIEGEPGGRQNLTLKRPFEANNEVDTKGQTGHKQIPGHIKMRVSTTAPQTPGHLPRACTCHHGMALKPPAIFALRPIVRVRTWQRRRRRWQHMATSTNMSHPSHTRYVRLHASNTSCIPSRAHQIKALFPLTACKMHFTSVP